MRFRLLIPLLTAALLAALPASSASAASCSDRAQTSLTDADGAVYGFDGDADIFTDNRDAFNNSGNPYFDREYNSGYYPNDSNGCSYEDGNREVVFPADTDSVPGGVEVQQKWYVPADAPAFARQLTIFRNKSDAVKTLQFYRWGRNEYSTTDVTSTSSGDETGTAADDWLVYNNSADATDPHVAFGWQGSDARRRGAADQVFEDCCGQEGDPFNPITDGFNEPQVRYQTLVLAPGETKTFVLFYAMRGSAADARQAAIDLSGGSERLFAAMSSDEALGLQNFVAPDADADGAANASDNCLYVANADQADTDRDGSGNACDADDDGDGLSDTAEASFGTNPASADTDGDGKADPADACPKVAGTTADGCPVLLVAGPAGPAAAAVTRVVRVLPAGVSARSTSRRVGNRLTVTTTGSVALPRGLDRAAACDFGVLAVQVKSRSRTLSTRYAELRPDCSYRSTVVFTGRSRFRRAKSLDIATRFNGNAFLLRAPAGRTKVPIR